MLATGLLYLVKERLPGPSPKRTRSLEKILPSPPTLPPSAVQPATEPAKYDDIDTSRWVVWTYPEFGIKLRHPSTLTVSEHQVSRHNATWRQSLIAQFAPPVLPGEAANPPTFALGVDRAETPVSPEEYFLKLQKEHMSLPPSPYVSRAFSIERTLINGVHAIRIGFETEREDEVWEYVFFPPHYSDLIFSIDFSEGGGSTLLPDPLTVFEAMVRTVEFLE